MSRRKQANPRPIIVYEEEERVVPEDFIEQGQGHLDGPEDEAENEANAQDSDTFDEFAPLIMDTSTLEDEEQRQNSSTTKALSSITNNNNNNNHDLKESAMVVDIPSPKLTDSTVVTNGDIIPSPEATSPLPDQSGDDSLSQSSMSSSRRGSKTLDDDESEIDDDLDDLVDELIKNKILPVSGEDGEKFICPICNCSLLNLHDLTVHIRSHNVHSSGNSTNTCKICGKILSSQSSLDRHMLVHSGERPFKCKVCNMSFTTNGNMHRHSRIHSKEENMNAAGGKLSSRRGKNSWRPRNNMLNQNGSSLPTTPERQKTSYSSLNPLSSSESPSMVGRPDNHFPQLSVGMKRHFSTSELSPQWISPAKRQMLNSNGDSNDSSPIKYDYQILPSKSEDSEDQGTKDEQELGDKDSVLHCPVCSKTFLCKYGLETHLETHPNYTNRCFLCNLTFKTPRNLRMHRLMVHTQNSSRDDVPRDENNLCIGFHDLSFVDFSVGKFPLIAKHHCEKNIRTSSSAYLNFTCKRCLKAFPCETSLLLHTWSHSPEKNTQCPLCECDYTDINELHTHLLKHMSDKAFSDLRPSQRRDEVDELKPDNLNKQDFMAMFDLKGTEEHHNDLEGTEMTMEKVPKSIKMEKNINNDYFPKIGQVFSPGVSAIAPMFGNLPIFRGGSSPNLDDFHKMLQIATNMNMLPSMGAGLLSTNLSSSPSKHLSASSENIPPTASGNPSVTPIFQNGTSSGSPSPSPVSTSDGGLSGFGLSDLADVKAMGNGQFPCKYCDTVFSSYRSLKGHIRTHLGLSPYKCNLCIYSSADKSTLIRHLRTHNGERPFQCLVCDFAFTTKANCERHVRKKHLLTDKDEIEKAITFNKVNSDSTTIPSDSFHSPDTVCKHCGIDFRYFRALKHHLRTHNSNSQQPFQCQLCLGSFCTKANCVRHIQKQHPEINDNQIEQKIKTVEHVSEDLDSFGESTSDDGLPLYSDSESRNTPFDMRSTNSTPQPPAAHSTPKPRAGSINNSRHASPSPSPSPLRMDIKKEPVDTFEDQPLDFSVKQGGKMNIKREPMSPVSREAPLNTVGKKSKDDIPMDLTVKRKSYSPVHIAPKPVAVSGVSGLAGFHSAGAYQCKYCPMGFSSNTLLLRHMRSSHGHNATTSGVVTGSTTATDSPLLASKLAAQPTFEALTLDQNLIVPKNALTISSFQFVPSKGIFHARPIRPRPKHNSQTIQILQEKVQQNLKRSAATRSPSASGSESDLTPVTKMMDATDPLKFKQLFMLAPSEDNSASNSPAPVKEPIFKPTILNTAVRISLEHCKAINRELDILEKEGDVDEDALAQVREMALSVKEECTSTSAPTQVPILPRPSTASPVESQRNTNSELTTTNLEDKDENSTDSGTTVNSAATQMNERIVPVKKKRNSYADSPHKLSCPYCPRAFPWVSSLTRHLLTHTGQKPFKCPRCPVTFSTKSNRERHLIRKHGVNMLDPMSRQTMDRPYKCPLCVFSSFSTQSNLLKHYKDRHNGINLPDDILEIEQMSAADIKAATIAMETHAATQQPILEECYEEDDYEEKDDLSNSIDSEEKMDDMEDVDVDVDVDDSSPPTLLPHRPLEIDLQEDSTEIGDTKPKTDEELVQKIIAEQKAIAEHQAKLESRIQMDIGVNMITPKVIKLEAPVLFEAKTPFEVSKPFTGSAERQINPERDNYDVDKITTCWKCNESFPSRKILVRHLKEHNIDLPFKCYLCDASYDSRLDCLNHQAKHHASDWTILKDKNKVINIDHFSTHMDKVVENNCNKLDQGTVLEIPASGPDDTKMEVVSADYMQRKVYCSLCPKRFWSLQDLRRHMRSHTGERPFECDICQKRFTLKHSMMRHRKKHAGAPACVFNNSDDEDSNPLVDEKVSGLRPIKPAPSRNATVLHFNNTSLPLRENMPINTMVFSSPLSLTAGTISQLSQSALNSISSVKLNGGTTATKESTFSEGSKLLRASPSVSSLKGEAGDSSADMLQNLLGMENSDIDKLLESAGSAASFLGVSSS